MAHPLVAGGGVAALGMMRALFTTTRGRDLLLRLNGIKPGTPVADSLWQQVGKEMPKLMQKPPEEPPEGPPAGGGSSPPNPPQPPAGSAAAIPDEYARQKQAFKASVAGLPLDPDRIEWVHGTTPEGAESIRSSGKFKTEGVTRQYDYSEFGPDAVYLGPKGSWWFDPDAGGRNIDYGAQVPVNLSPSAKIFTINSKADADKLAKSIGLASGKALSDALWVDNYQGPEGPQGVARAREITNRLRSLGIDGVHISGQAMQEENPVFTGPQLVVFNKDVINPEGPPTGGGPSSGPPAPGGGNIADTLQNQADAAIQRMRDRGTFSGTQSNAMFPAEDLADMAIWGAAKMAKGVTQLGAWSKEMLADAGSSAARLKPQLPKLYVLAQKTLERHIANTAGNLPSTQKMLSMYRQGAEGQDWYRNTKAELQSVFGPDTDKFVDFLAATSPNTTVAANTSLALKAYMQWKTGKPFTGYLPETIKSLNKAAAGEEFGGLKVQSFRKNLHGDPVPVTVDRWIARALGFGDQPTVPQYKFMDYLISQVAAKKGLEPRQLQAAIWKTIKDTEGLAGQGGESYEVLVRRKLLSDPDLAAAIQQAAPQR